MADTLMSRQQRGGRESACAASAVRRGPKWADVCSGEHKFALSSDRIYGESKFAIAITVAVSVRRFTSEPL